MQTSLFNEEQITTGPKIPGFKQVSEDEFFKGIGQQDVHIHFIGNEYPYTKHFKTRYGEVKGITSESWANNDGKYPKVKRYYLPTPPGVEDNQTQKQ